MWLKPFVAGKMVNRELGKNLWLCARKPADIFSAARNPLRIFKNSCGTKRPTVGGSSMLSAVGSSVAMTNCTVSLHDIPLSAGALRFTPLFPSRRAREV